MRLILLFALVFVFPAAGRGDPPAPEVGVVCGIRVLSDKVPDISDLEAWKKSFIKDGMTDEEKALAVWKTVRTFQHQDAPPVEHLQHEEVVQDPLKVFNVYGYGFCSMASCEVEALSRYVGLQARGRIIHAHSVPEVYYDGAWHLLDGSLMCYFPKVDGKAASVNEIIAGVKEWYGKNPDFRKNEKKLGQFMRGGGWKKGPEILSRCPQYDGNGWFEAATHGWYSTMQEYDCPPDQIYEYGYSQGYRVDLRLRAGERLVRNWSHKGLHVNMKGGGAPGCMKMKTGQDALRYTPGDGDLAPGRVGNGTLEYDVPLAKGAFRGGALVAENLTDAAEVRDPSKPGVLVIRMPSSYVYLTGKATLKAAVGTGGSVAISFSDNNGLDWKELATLSEAGGKEIDLGDLVFRRYDYRVKFELKGKGTALQALRFGHDIQHSQRPLPALAQGVNTITFSAGPPEGTVTVEGSTNLKNRGKQLVYADFHPRVNGIGEPNLFIGETGKGDITFPVAVPGDLVRLRFGAHYRARDARDGWDYQVSFDGGSGWKTVDRAAGPTAGHCHYTVFSDVPPGTREARVRFSATSRNATGIFNFRIDADYREPFGGFRPVKVAYAWEEAGRPREHVHIARKPGETWTISCSARPEMKSISLELAK